MAGGQQKADPFGRFFSFMKDLLQLGFGFTDSNHPIPRFVCCGMQSRGKSSFLEFILQRPFNFISQGTATRCPVYLTLHKGPSPTGRSDYCMFQAFPGAQQEVVTFEQLRGKVGDRMREIGTVSRFTHDAIQIEVYDAKVDAILVDTPGMLQDGNDGKEDIDRIVVKELLDRNAIALVFARCNDDPEVQFPKRAALERLIANVTGQQHKLNRTFLVLTGFHQLWENVLIRNADELAARYDAFSRWGYDKTFMVAVGGYKSGEQSATYEAQTAALRAAAASERALVRSLCAPSGSPLPDAVKGGLGVDPLWGVLSEAFVVQCRAYLHAVEEPLGRAVRAEHDALLALERDLRRTEKASIQEDCDALCDMLMQAMRAGLAGAPGQYAELTERGVKDPCATLDAFLEALKDFVKGRASEDPSGWSSAVMQEALEQISTRHHLLAGGAEYRRLRDLFAVLMELQPFPAFDDSAVNNALGAPEGHNEADIHKASHVLFETAVWNVLSPGVAWLAWSVRFVLWRNFQVARHVVFHAWKERMPGSVLEEIMAALDGAFEEFLEEGHKLAERGAYTHIDSQVNDLHQAMARLISNIAELPVGVSERKKDRALRTVRPSPQRPGDEGEGAATPDRAAPSTASSGVFVFGAAGAGAGVPSITVEDGEGGEARTPARATEPVEGRESWLESASDMFGPLLRKIKRRGLVRIHGPITSHDAARTADMVRAEAEVMFTVYRLLATVELCAYPNSFMTEPVRNSAHNSLNARKSLVVKANLRNALRKGVASRVDELARIAENRRAVLESQAKEKKERIRRWGSVQEEYRQLLQDMAAGVASVGSFFDGSAATAQGGSGSGVRPSAAPAPPPKPLPPPPPAAAAPAVVDLSATPRTQVGSPRKQHLASPERPATARSPRVEGKGTPRKPAAGTPSKGKAAAAPAPSPLKQFKKLFGLGGDKDEGKGRRARRAQRRSSSDEASSCSSADEI
eukprot:tig00020961_g16647.t1